jgi:gliding motility-associated-like protein
VDGNELNDCFRLKTISTECYSLRIYNRWGELVYEKEKTEGCWNGKLNNTGAEVPEGVYYYTLELNNKNYNGTIELIR